MRDLRKLLLSVGVGCALWATCTGAASAATYGHAGRFITDGQGRVVTLHGFNLVNKIQASGYAPDAIGFLLVRRHGGGELSHA